MRQPSSPAVLALALLFMADPRTAGAALLDPTRPLVGSGREETAPPKPTDATSAEAPLEASASAAAPPVLQSLQVPQQGEATAIVDGQLLKVGAKLGVYEVTHIDAHGLMVRGPSGRERWTLAGVEVLDSRQSPASLKMGVLGEARKPARRPAGAEAPPVLSDPPARPSTGVAPVPLVFPLALPPGQPLPRPLQPPDQAPQTTPVPTGPARAAVKQAWADTPQWIPATAPRPVAAPMTVALQPVAAASKRTTASGKRALNSPKTWHAAAPKQALRMDLDDMRRMLLLNPAPAQPSSRLAAPARWQHPLGPDIYGAWAGAWAAGPAIAQRPAVAQAETALVLARWQPPKAWPARVGPPRYSSVPGPRPMPASVVWREATPRQPWQPHGSSDLPGAHTSQWASAATPLLRIAALEAKVLSPRSFAQASSKPVLRSAPAKRWEPARPAAMVLATAPVTHVYPTAWPIWRAEPIAHADNASSTQVAYALETP